MDFLFLQRILPPILINLVIYDVLQLKLEKDEVILQVTSLLQVF